VLAPGRIGIIKGFPCYRQGAGAAIIHAKIDRVIDVHTAGHLLGMPEEGVVSIQWLLLGRCAERQDPFNRRVG